MHKIQVPPICSTLLQRGPVVTAEGDKSSYSSPSTLVQLDSKSKIQNVYVGT